MPGAAPVAAGALAESHTPPGSPLPSPQLSSAVTYDHAARVAAAMGGGSGKQDLEAMTDFFNEQLHLKDPVKVKGSQRGSCHLRAGAAQPTELLSHC